MRLSSAYVVFLVTFAYVISAAPLDLPVRTLFGHVHRPLNSTSSTFQSIPHESTVAARALGLGIRPVVAPAPNPTKPFFKSSRPNVFELNLDLGAIRTARTRLKGAFKITNTVLKPNASGQKLEFGVERPGPLHPCKGYFYAKDNGALDETKGYGIDCDPPKVDSTTITTGTQTGH
ncbi:hypothetical protein BDP27DRAFT_1340330 [Rhodocollybia butyracea]|uniref:Uncharacterized protein n=1 Tax=Rhodocollybia butyracea TaxID=206335 RepID=A0A9P5P850_9AGAR|nr:hypothetical protein BDP27DRAFT_1340330 [Rhodocollybia butyracea]